MAQSIIDNNAVVKQSTTAGVGLVSDAVQGYGTVTSSLIREVGSRIFYLDPSAAPFTLLTDRAGSVTTSNPKFEWYEKTLRPKATQINNAAGYSNTATTLNVDEGRYVQLNDLVLVPRTGEIMRCTGNTDTSITVTRGVAGTTAAALVDNDDLFVIGSAFAEGADVSVPDEWQEVFKYNLTQIFRRPFGASRTREATDSYLGKNRPRIRAEKAIEHAIDIERAYMFGGRSEAGAGVDSLYRTTGGFTFWATQNVQDFLGAALNEADLEAWLEDVFTHTASGDSRVLFASALVVSAFDMMSLDKRRLEPSDRTFGLTVNQFVTSHGTLNVVKHRLLENGPGGNGYGSWAFCVDPRRLMNRPLVGGATVLKTDRQSPGRDGWVDEYLTESGLQFMNPEVHGILKNVGRSV